MRSLRRMLLSMTLLPMLCSCAGVQSALDPVGGEASRISVLSWVLIAFCSAVFALVLVLAAVAILGRNSWREILGGERSILVGGLVFPAASLTALLSYSVALMSAGHSEGDVGALRIAVVGERWWWRVFYVLPDGRKFESANEVRLPVGRKVRIDLTSNDVIHSFWVPKLAGKLDMIPGRTNTLTLQAAEPSVSRGQCAEYCGGPHAFMSFFVIALEPAEFDAWLEREASVARTPDKQIAIQGAALFMQNGCGGCHSVRGTNADGRIGPDLTHVGSRHSLAAATLPNTAASFARWLVEGQHIKPENLMPSYEFLTEKELVAIATYLEQLD